MKRRLWRDIAAVTFDFPRLTESYSALYSEEQNTSAMRIFVSYERPAKCFRVSGPRGRFV
ncbi:MAG: hypothetical protein ABIJ15_02620 [bacterium]